jgi:glycosyltransferase involved in cell wall biosynthesis
MDYAPNIDAVEYFVKDIFPLIKKQVPETYFVIAGQRPVAKVLQLRSEDVWVTGFIPDLSEEYAKAHIVVSPLRIGAGTQNKVLEALSMNVPVVSTFVGYEGLELPENIGVLPAHNAEDFASNCVKLLADISFRNSMGSQGGQMIRMNFSWEGISQKLQKYFEQIKNKNV